MVRSFPDAGVLISAARSRPPLDLIAFNYFDDANRLFVSSPMLHLETVPKAAYMQRQEELAFYESFFGNQHVEWSRNWDRMEQIADREARQHGLSAIDALHIAAAYLLDADELVTTERPGKAIYRTRRVRVLYLYPAIEN